MALSASNASATSHWLGAGTGQLALAGGQYYCPVPAETLVQTPGTAHQTAEQLVYAAAAGPQPAAYQTVDLADSGHHLLAAGQSSEVLFTLNIRLFTTKVEQIKE